MCYRTSSFFNDSSSRSDHQSEAQRNSVCKDMQSKMQHKTPQTQERIKSMQVGWVHAYLSICFIMLYLSKDPLDYIDSSPRMLPPDNTCRHAKSSCVAFQVAVQLRLAEEVLTVRSCM